jgi:hypothetical protein
MIGTLGLKKNFNLLTDIEVPLVGDEAFVLNTIKNDFPEHFIAIDWQSDLMDGFHPLSKNSFAFMSVHLKALKSNDEKTIIVRRYIKAIQAQRSLYIHHE